MGGRETRDFTRAKAVICFGIDEDLFLFMDEHEVE